MSRLAKSAAPLETICDSLIITVIGPEIGERRFSKYFDQNRPVHNDTLSGIPAGTNRTVRVFTIDRAGDTVHCDSIKHSGIRIDPGAVVTLNVALIPALGSIYLQLEDVPTTVDSVIANFTTADKRSWGSRGKRSAKMFLSIDKIPHTTRGVLTVFAINPTKDTLFRASDSLTFNACKMESVSLAFSSAPDTSAITPGILAINMTIVRPGVTAASGSMLKSDTVTAESGELIITEIMHAANDSEYVEIFNPAEIDRTFDSLYLVVDGKRLVFTDIAVGARKTYVIGRILLSWCDTAPSSASALDLTKTGNRITLIGSGARVIDRVFFTGETNGIEWPVVSGKRAVVLDETINDARLNDFGRYWRAASAPIDGSASQFGTPGIR